MKNGGERRWQELCAQAAATTDPLERAEILRELAEILSEMVGYIPGEDAKEKS